MMKTAFKKKKTRKKPSTPLPQALEWKRILILPTRFGLLFVILIAGMLIGSINYNNNLGFLLTFLLGSMALVSMVHTYKNLKGIRIISAKSHPVFAGDIAVFEFWVGASGRVRAAVTFKFENNKEVRQDLRSGVDNRFSVPVTTHTRGVLRPGPLKVTTRYPLGLFAASCNLNIGIECIVYPQPINVPFKPTKGVLPVDDKGRKKFSGVDDFQGLKSYQPGDPLQRISWKTYSRGLGLFTKLFVQHSDTEVLLDWHTLDEPDIERKLSMLCHEVLTAHRRNISYGLKLPRQTIPHGKDIIHKHKCLKALAMFSTEIDLN
ncbi:MAG: DUF58 domain-containing protein [Desulfobacterales bacterium]|nr:MAG: DUF58 domain-containing protein [Desulfobacterales bacterium]